MLRDEVDGGDLERLGNDADGVQGTLGLERTKQAGDVERRVNGGDDEVEASLQLLEFAVALGVVDDMRAELLGLGFLVVAGGEGVDFAAPFVGELERHVPKAADADDADARGGRQIVDNERRKDRDATAEERADLGGVEALGQRARPGPLHADAIGEGAVAADDGPADVGAEVVVTGETFGAREATVGGPADADFLADLEALGLGAERDDGAGGFMAGDERIPGPTPFVVEHGEIGMAQAAIVDLDLDFLGREIAGVELEGLERGFGAVGCVGVEFGHGGSEVEGCARFGLIRAEGKRAAGTARCNF